MPNMRSQSFKTFGMLLALSGILAVFATMPVLAAESYPTKPVRLIIPFPPGGSNDIVGRLMAAKLSNHLGKQVVVDNRGGAGGVLGTEMAAKSEPDGYTLLICAAAHTVNASLHTLPYDPIKSFSPVAKLAIAPGVLAVHPSVPVNSVKELIALAKEKPGKLVFASVGVGTFAHLACEDFRSMAGIDFMIVQFKGGGPAMTDQLGGHSQLSFGSLIQTLPHIQSGKFRALGVGGSKRSPILPDVPTIAEAGVPGYEATTWYFILAAAGTPQVIVDRLNKEFSVILSSAEMQAQLAAQGARLDEKMTLAEFRPFIAAEVAKWKRVVKEANIKVEQ